MPRVALRAPNPYGPSSVATSFVAFVLEFPLNAWTRNGFANATQGRTQKMNKISNETLIVINGYQVMTWGQYKEWLEEQREK